MLSVHRLAIDNALHHGIALTALEAIPTDGNSFINSILNKFISRHELSLSKDCTNTMYYRFAYVNNGINISCHLHDFMEKSKQEIKNIWRTLTENKVCPMVVSNNMPFATATFHKRCIVCFNTGKISDNLFRYLLLCQYQSQPLLYTKSTLL